MERDIGAQRIPEIIAALSGEPNPAVRRAVRLAILDIADRYGVGPSKPERTPMVPRRLAARSGDAI
ncbi:hypothetical protein [Azospirillum canadense]|uniref:hypothetical protein n=1 Tax=Azospirillum canadense TaxID=403962 RepID=UPI0022278A34|nr:hypothetical protein [Azospirillum canadense]MCW2239334.1 hypothetical protein [Azospirillum canadense]